KRMAPGRCRSCPRLVRRPISGGSQRASSTGPFRRPTAFSTLDLKTMSDTIAHTSDLTFRNVLFDSFKDSLSLTLRSTKGTKFLEPDKSEIQIWFEELIPQSHLDLIQSDSPKWKIKISKGTEGSRFLALIPTAKIELKPEEAFEETVVLSHVG